MQVPLKEKKAGKARRRSARSAQETLLDGLPREEEGDEQRNKLEMTNLQLFFWKSQAHRHAYPSAFELIRLPATPDPAEVTLPQLLQPSFPVLAFKVKELARFAALTLHHNPIAEKFGKTQELFAAIAQGYNCVSYHNFSHAFNLMLINFRCLETEPALGGLFSGEERFCITVAALAHDLGHGGTNNQFEVQRQTELARLSNNQAVLEHMHVRSLWRLLQQRPELDFLPSLADAAAARKNITGLILATDMAAHGQGLSRLRAVPKGRVFEHKWTVMEQVFHACDISNPTLEYDHYVGWAALLAFEFDTQARQEQQLGLEVSRGLAYGGLGSFYSDQEWFLGSILQPLWREISDLLPNLGALRVAVERNLERVREEAAAWREE